MITFKMKINGQDVEASAESVQDAVALMAGMKGPQPLKAASDKKITRVMKKVRAARRGGSHPGWKMEEVQALHENRNLAPRLLVQIPALRGRSISSVSAYRRFTNPANLHEAPRQFREKLALVTSGTSSHDTGLLDD